MLAYSTKASLWSCRQYWRSDMPASACVFSSKHAACSFYASAWQQASTAKQACRPSSWALCKHTLSTDHSRARPSHPPTTSLLTMMAHLPPDSLYSKTLTAGCSMICSSVFGSLEVVKVQRWSGGQLEVARVLALQKQGQSLIDHMQV